MDAQYKTLNRAQLSYDYLHTNSTTHEFLFGALAELLDNARDASATKINIYSVLDESVRGGYLLCFLDDGQGMSPEETSDIITFGKSTKKTMDSQIGMYGNGLKSGSMRIGNDFIMFTKKGPSMTCVFLSRTFHEEEQIDEVVVPMPSFDSPTKKPIAKTIQEKEKHLIEMGLILKYSPFKTEAQFMKEFDKIEGDSGSLVIIYNLKLLDSGEPELDVKTVPQDIVLSNPVGSDFDTDEGLMPERKSFRAYTSVLYVDPRMRVYIQGKKVQTKRLANSLYKPRMYRYSSSRFKTRSEVEAKKAQEEAKTAENRAKEAESKARNLEIKWASTTSKDQRAELRRVQTIATELRKEAQLKKMAAERKAKLLRDPKTLTFVFGINIDNRQQDGMFVYNCSRLIKMYQKVGPQADSGVFCSGVVGIVDVPYLVLEPTHNKQDFADAKEYRHLLQAMGEHMLQYWRDINIAEQGVTKFWEGFGYISANWKEIPSSDQKFVRKRAMQVSVTIQCDLCLKWRILPFSSNNIGKVFPDEWVCSMNPDPSHNRCSSAEEKLNMPEGMLKKAVKSKEDKEKDLAEEIRKKQEQLEKLNKGKKKVPEPDSEDEEEEEEESEEDSPKSKRKSKTKKSDISAMKQHTNRFLNTSYSRKRRTTELDDGEDSEYMSTKEKKRRESSNIKKKMVKGTSDEEENKDEPDDGNPSESIGTKVEVKVQNKWVPGVVVKVNQSNSMWKIRQDRQSSNDPDTWYEKNGQDVRIVPISKSNNQASVKPLGVTTTAQSSTSSTSSASIGPQDGSYEIPSSSSGLTEDIANGFRMCLRYFLPPQWMMDKDSVSGLTLQDLASFPLEDFFDHYERGLKKLVSSFQLEAHNKSTESDMAKEKLYSLRKLIAKLLKSINEDFDIDPDANPESDQVDELLALCVKQVLQQGQGDEASTS